MLVKIKDFCLILSSPIFRGTYNSGLAIGRKGDYSNDYFKGKIDDIRVYNRTLSLAEIQQLFFCGNYLQVATNNDTTLCLGASKTLQASGAANRYLWSTGDTLATITVSPTTTSTYWVRGQLGNTSCYSYDTVTITVTNCSRCINCSIVDSINTNLMACFPFNNDVTDQSNNGNNGTATNIIYPQDRVGKSASASNYDGTSSIIHFNPSTLQLNTYSYCAWVKLNSLPFSGNAFSILGIGGSTNDQGILIGNNYGSDNGWIINSYGTNGISYATSTGTMPSINSWYFVCQTRDNNGAKLYVNGNLILSRVIPNINAGYSGAPIEAVIGARTNASSRQYFNGIIDDVRIYNKVLSVGEVNLLYYSLSIPKANAGQDKTVCLGDSVQLSASGGISYSWNTSSGLSDSTISNPWVKPIVNTSYYLKISNGTCYDFDTVKVFIAASPTIIINNDTSVCSGTQLTLSASGSSTRYLWSNGDTTSSIIVNINEDTLFTVRGQLGFNGCYAFDSVHITIKLPTPINIGNDTILCNGSKIKLSATAGTPRIWSTGDTSVSINITVNADSVNFIPQKVWVKSGTGTCFSYDTINIFGLTMPRISPLINGKTTICAGESMSLVLKNIPGWAKIKWSTNDTSKSIIVNPSISTRYYVSYLNNECGFKDSIDITVNPKPIIQISSNDTICIGGTSHLTIRGASSYIWNNAVTDSDLFVSPIVTTTYWVIGSDGTCDSDTQKVTVVVSQKTKALFSANPTKGTNPLTVQFTNLSSYTSNYYWDFGNGDTSTGISPSHTFTKEGNFTTTLIAYNSHGCSDTFRIDIIVQEKFKILIPTVFSPDNNGINDVFEVYLEGAKSLNGQIFNRWGECIYEWNMPGDKGWDGTYNGWVLPEGNYTYIINVKDISNYRHIYKGLILLVQ